jgi:peptide subunit release factor RF-3
MEALRQLVKEGVIKIYTPEDVKNILLKDEK